MSMVISGDNGLTFPAGSTQVQAGNYQTMVNRIINGRMEIDQRNAGASVTITNTSSATYTVDRWFAYGSLSSRFSVQQNAGSVTPPAGFTSYLGATSLASTSVGSGEQFILGQYIEGFNCADLGWGASGASAVTISFWVRSSLTGTFGGSLMNDAFNRSYPFTYTISAANTWEQKSVTIAGDTTGTWLKNNGTGIRVHFGLGVGSTLSGTSGSWAGSTFVSATGATSVVGTNGATFYITGVDLRVGSYTVVPQDFRAYGTELALCQRYCQVFGGDSNYNSVGTNGIAATATNIDYYSFPLAVKLRANPSLSYSGNWRVDDGFTASYSVTNISIQGIALNQTTGVIGINVASGLTAGRAYQLQSNNNTTARLILNSEL